ncbi:MAG: hypothetical protein JKY37_02555, partial [Nannocystaceae bacterium]|nr:hypothetical protein [Nannocystaceae bacterium]
MARTPEASAAGRGVTLVGEALASFGAARAPDDSERPTLRAAEASDDGRGRASTPDASDGPIQDFTCYGGSLGAAHAKKICKIMDFALENRIPMIGINDSGGARIQEGVDALGGYAEIFYRNVKASGVIPQISLIMGPCAGGAVYSPAITDFIFMVDKTSYMFVTGPDVIKTVTHEEVTKEELGGAATHNEKSGVANFKCHNEDECFERVRELLAFIPQSNFREATTKYSSDSIYRDNNKLRDIVPANPKKPYDMKEIIFDIVDDANFL